MKLRWLEAFRAIMTLGTVSQAAEHLRVTQPAVSRMLASLEAELGFKLFERTHGRLLPTEDCEHFFREVERLLSGIIDISSIARDIRERRGERLRVVSMESAAHGVLSHVLATIVVDHPDLRLSLDIRGRRDVQYWMAGQQFDIGVAVLPIDHAGLSSEPFIEVDLYVVMPAGHRLARKESIALSDLRLERFITLPKPTLLRHEIDRAMQQVGPFHALAETSTLHSACLLATDGAGITIVDSFTIAGVGPEKLTYALLESPVRRVYGFLYSANQERSKVTQKFTERMTGAAATVVMDIRSCLAKRRGV